MNSLERRIAALTRDTGFLLRAALAVLAVAALVGFALSKAGLAIDLGGAGLGPDEAGGWVVESPYESALRAGDYVGVFLGVLRSWSAAFWWPMAAAALVCGAVWFAIVLAALGLSWRSWPWGLAAVALGAASTLVTLFLLVLQEGLVGFAETGDMYRDAVYFTAGVGLREEFSKLLLFAPLLPFLRRAGSPALALACASWVGLGFAAEENMFYFARSAAGDMWSRFITANFFHLSATGLTGYALYRFACAPAKNWEMALGTFLAVVGLHGVYNFVISNPDVAESWNFVAIVVIGVLAYWYFGEADAARATGRRAVVSPMAYLVLGSAVILGISLVIIFLALPPGRVFSGFVYASAGIAPVAFIFINRFRGA